MGWAGPAQPTGPDSAQKCRADFGPKWIGPISAQKLIFSSGPDPAQKAGLGQDQPGPSNKTSWARTVLAQHKKPTGGIISPPSSCMQNECSACRRKRRSRK